MGFKRVIRGSFAALIFLSLQAAVLANNYLPSGNDDLLRFAPVQSGQPVEMLILNRQGNWRQYSDFLGLGTRWVYAENGNNRMWVFNPLSGFGELLVNLDAPVGQSFQTPLGPCSSVATIGERQATIETPAGQFNNVIRVDFSGSCQQQGLQSAWFAPGIGPIQWARRSEFGSRFFVLTQAFVNGQELPAPTELTISTTLPVNRIVIDDQPAILASMTLHNPGNQDIDLLFVNGKTFDILLIDQTGAVVRQYSRDRMYTMALQFITIPAGGSQTFGDWLELVDDEGQPLDTGTYTLRIEVPGYRTPEEGGFNNQVIAIEAPLHLDRRISIP